jgi:hypothetical protein
MGHFFTTAAASEVPVVIADGNEAEGEDAN